MVEFEVADQFAVDEHVRSCLVDVDECLVVVVLDADGTVVYTQLVDEITTEPDYDSALAALA